MLTVGTIFNFIISQSIEKQHRKRWSLVILYAICIFPSVVLMAYAISAEKHKKYWSTSNTILVWLCWISPTMFFTAAVAIAAVGSTFAAYVPLFWLIGFLLSLIGVVVDWYFGRVQIRPRKRKKH